MNLSLVSQKPSSPTTLGVLAALRAASEESDYVTEVRVAQPLQWQPSKDEAAILLLEEEGCLACSALACRRQCTGIAGASPVGASTV